MAAAAVLFDLFLLMLLPRPTVERRLPGSAALNVGLDVHLRLHNPGAGALQVEVFDHHPPEGAVEGLPRTLPVPARGWAEMTYRLRPTSARESAVRPRSSCACTRRCACGSGECRRASRRCCACIPTSPRCPATRCSPPTTGFADVGILQRRRRGEGMDFDQLREYREGDSLRKIDWKASQRMNKLISREYQDERDQQVLFLVDCGRRMRAKDDDCSHFDHALDATLLLAYVGLRQGDAVGLMTMSGEERFLAPHKSREMVNRILNTVYDLQPGLLTSDYYQAAVILSKRLRKRAMIVIISNLRDEDDDTLLPALRLLQKRHLVLFASLRERALDEAVDLPVRRLRRRTDARRRRRLSAATRRRLPPAAAQQRGVPRCAAAAAGGGAGQPVSRSQAQRPAVSAPVHARAGSSVQGNRADPDSVREHVAPAALLPPSGRQRRAVIAYPLPRDNASRRRLPGRQCLNAWRSGSMCSA